jgi:hypothetical protein
MSLLMHMKIRRLLQSKRGKLFFVLSFLLITFIVTSVLNRIASTHNVWHFDCHADGYFSHQGELPLTVDKSNLRLTLYIEHNQAELTYRVESSTHDPETVQLSGKVEEVHMGSFTYHLALSLPPTRWQDNSLLRPYLQNEFGITASHFMDGFSISQEVQVIDLDDTFTRGTLKFLPSNNVWACQLISPNTAD